MANDKGLTAELIKYTALVMLIACAYSYAAYNIEENSAGWLHKAGAAASEVINFVAEEQPHVQ